MAITDSQANATILYGESPASILLAGTVVKGDALGYSDGWKRALATTASVIQIRCVAGEDGVTGKTIIAYFGTTKIGGSRFSGATALGKLYVDESTNNGKYTQTAPSTSGDATTEVGVMLDAATAVIQPQHAADSTA